MGSEPARASEGIPGQRSSPDLSQELYGRVVPRFIRFRDAPRYLGMDKNRFNREVRPALTHLPIGVQGVAFDRLDLDRWADEYKSRNGHLAAQSGRKKPWETKGRRVSQNAVGLGISTSSSEASAFGRALQQVTSRKRSRSS